MSSDKTTNKIPRASNVSNKIDEVVLKHLPVENEVFKHRLLTREKGGDVIQNNLDLCEFIDKFREYGDTALLLDETPVNKNGNENINEKEKLTKELKKILNALNNGLLLNKLEMRKIALMVKTAEADCKDYEREHIKLNETIQSLKREIHDSKELHSVQKRVRRNREQYEQLAREANKFPPCYETEEKLNKVITETNSIRKEDDKVTNELIIKERQTHLLMQSLFDLKSTLTENEEKIENNEEGEEVEEADESTSEVNPMDIS